MKIICNRVITNLEELREFCDAAEAAASTHPSTIYIQQPLEIWMAETVLTDGSKVYDVHSEPASQDVLDEMAEAGRAGTC